MVFLITINYMCDIESTIPIKELSKDESFYASVIFCVFLLFIMLCSFLRNYGTIRLLTPKSISNNVSLRRKMLLGSCVCTTVTYIIWSIIGTELSYQKGGIFLIYGSFDFIHGERYGIILYLSMLFFWLVLHAVTMIFIIRSEKISGIKTALLLTLTNIPFTFILVLISSLCY